MDLGLKSKVVLVTGSTRGIGLSIAQRLMNEGCTIIINGRNEDAVDKISRSLEGSLGIVCDVSVWEDVQMMAKTIKTRFGRIDGLVCNVGLSRSVPPGDETPTEWLKSFHQNFFSTTNTVEAFRPLMKSKGASIVCISSICGIEIVPEAPVTYSVAKASLNFYVKSISKILARDGVRINAVAPGNVLFDGSVWDRKVKANRDAVSSFLQQEVSLGRLGHPDEVANLAVYLLSDVSAFATGAIWPLDGGQTRS